MPDFHIYSGSNDRWALGRPKEMAIIGSRFEQLLEYSIRNKIHSESYLTSTARRNNITLLSVHFQFMRMRATGKISGNDKSIHARHLKVLNTLAANNNSTT